MSTFINTLQVKENLIESGVEENSYKPYECAIEGCGIKFSDPEELKEHLNSHAER